MHFPHPHGEVVHPVQRPRGVGETASTQLNNQTDHLSNKLDETAKKIVAALIRPPQ
jgi:hypothetical protein